MSLYNGLSPHPASHPLDLFDLVSPQCYASEVPGKLHGLALALLCLTS